MEWATLDVWASINSYIRKSRHCVTRGYKFFIHSDVKN